MPDDIPEIHINNSILNNKKIWLPKLLVECDMAESTSQAKRLIQQGAVLLDNNKIVDSETELEIKNDMILKVGKKKRFCRIKL